MLISRCTDPANFALVGLPPYDLLDDLAHALREKGLDIDQVFERAVSCTSEFIYDPCRSGESPAVLPSAGCQLGAHMTHAHMRVSGIACERIDRACANISRS